MSGRTIQAGSTDQYCEVKVWTTADGVPNTTLVYNTAVMAIWYQIGNAAAVEVVVGGSPAPATMSAGGAHADWGIYHIAQGRYKIGLADAVVSAAANVTVWIVFTDCDSAPCEIDVVGYDKTTAIPDQVWDEATAGHTTVGTYGGRVVRSTNSNVEVQITGSNHIAADVHEFQTGVITAGDFATDAITAAALAADAVTEIQSGLASQASVDVIDGIVDTILVDTNDLQTNQGAWATATGFATPTNITAGTITTCTNLTNLPAGVQTSIDTVQAIAAGTVTGAGTATEVFVGTNATVTVTADSSGNRSAVVVT
tara:strand:- start:676 stop:1611 length:936 start_codon:yes stop_codon:yes gene_type:complete